MHNINTIYLFIFVLTVLVSLRHGLKIVSALLEKNPKPLAYTNRELVILGLSISYIITYIYVS